MTTLQWMLFLFQLLAIVITYFVDASLQRELPSVAIIRSDLNEGEDVFLSYAIEDVFSQYSVSAVIQDASKIGPLKDINGVLQVGDCGMTSKHFAANATTENVSYFLVLQEECKVPHLITKHAIPFYMASDQRKYPCLSHVIALWLSENISSSSRFKWARPNTNYNEAYLNCVGPSSYAPKIQKTLRANEGKAYLNGRKVLIATINRPPFLIFKMGGEGGQEIVKWRGYCIDMLDFLALKFNFSYKLILPPDGNWGAPTPNGTFNGMVGMVQRHEVDFAIASFTITHIRVIDDFPHRFYEDPTTILIPPPIEKKNLFAFLSPFESVVWLYILVGLVCTSSIMWLTSTYPREMRTFLYPHRDGMFLQSTNIGYFHYFWETSFILVSQSTKVKQTDSSRVLLGFWWIFSLILILSYTSTLISFLTVPRMENLIESLEELSNQDEILWTYRANTAFDHLFGKAEPPGTYHKIGSLLKKKPKLKVATDEEGVNAVLHNRMAFIKEKSWLDFAMENDYLTSGKCRLSQAPQTFFSAGFGWALQEGSSYLELFNDIFLRMRQTGLFDYWKMRYWPKPNECTRGRQGARRGIRALSLQDFAGHFLILGIGAALAFGLFILECTFRKFTKESPQ